MLVKIELARLQRAEALVQYVIEDLRDFSALFMGTAQDDGFEERAQVMEDRLEEVSHLQSLSLVYCTTPVEKYRWCSCTVGFRRK